MFSMRVPLLVVVLSALAYELCPAGAAAQNLPRNSNLHTSSAGHVPTSLPSQRLISKHILSPRPITPGEKALAAALKHGKPRRMTSGLPTSSTQIFKSAITTPSGGQETYGVAERSGILIDLSIADDFGRLPADLELAIFRVVQECLTNIHRHSESKTALIRITRENGRACIEVRDEGKGISLERMAEIEARGSGVGIAGIRERLRQFGGEMQIESNGCGTTVFAAIPLPKEAGLPDAEPLQTAV